METNDFFVQSIYQKVILVKNIVQIDTKKLPNDIRFEKVSKRKQCDVSKRKKKKNDTENR